MADRFLLSVTQMRRIEPYFPLSHGVARVGDRLVIRGIVFVIGNGLRPPLPTRGITACIPSKSNRKTPIAHDRVLYRQRHKIENIFGRIKNWRRIHTRYV